MTHDVSSTLVESDPCMCGSATLVMLVSRICITVMSITEPVIIHLRGGRGRLVSLVGPWGGGKADTEGLGRAAAPLPSGKRAPPSSPAPPRRCEKRGAKSDPFPLFFFAGPSPPARAHPQEGPPGGGEDKASGEATGRAGRREKKGKGRGAPATRSRVKLNGRIQAPRVDDHCRRGVDPDRVDAARREISR